MSLQIAGLNITTTNLQQAHFMPTWKLVPDIQSRNSTHQDPINNHNKHKIKQMYASYARRQIDG